MTLSAWSVVFAADVVADLGLIEDYLARAYRALGETSDEAARHAETRIDGIISTAERLGTAPFRGETQDDLLPGLRHLAIDSAIHWFVADADVREVRVLALFFGGQDHQRHMMVRLLRQVAP